jgi:hypothetical protein
VEISLGLHSKKLDYMPKYTKSRLTHTTKDNFAIIAPKAFRQDATLAQKFQMEDDNDNTFNDSN